MRVRQGGTWEPAMQLGKSKVVKELYIHKVGFLSAIPDRNRIRQSFFLRSGEKRSSRRKISRNNNNNKQKAQPR